MCLLLAFNHMKSLYKEYEYQVVRYYTNPKVDQIDMNIVSDILQQQLQILSENFSSNITHNVCFVDNFQIVIF